MRKILVIVVFFALMSLMAGCAGTRATGALVSCY